MMYMSLSENLKPIVGRKTFFGLLAVAVLVATFITVQPVSNAIVGGSAVEQGKYPFMISLQYKGEHRCGAALLSSTEVITAAHCVYGVYDEDPENLTVVVNRANLEDEEHGQVRKLDLSNGLESAILVHPRYRSWDNPGRDFRFDVAKLFLSEPITDVTPIKLPTLGEADLSQADSMANFIGYGEIDNDGTQTKQLNEVELSIFSDAKCKELEGEESLDFMGICAGTDGKGPCNRDSGGPLFREVAGEFYQLGVLSLGSTPCAGKDSYTRFVDLSSKILWDTFGETPRPVFMSQTVVPELGLGESGVATIRAINRTEKDTGKNISATFTAPEGTTFASNKVVLSSEQGEREYFGVLFEDNKVIVFMVEDSFVVSPKNYLDFTVTLTAESSLAEEGRDSGSLVITGGDAFPVGGKAFLYYIRNLPENQ